MKEIIIGLLGGGALAEVINIMLHARNSRRKSSAEALDSEVTTMEHTLRVLSETMDREMARFEHERQQMQAEIDDLHRQVAELTAQLSQLRMQNAECRMQNEARA